MSKVEVDQVTQQSGTTLTVGGGACKTAVVDATTVTLGRCGGTVALASGATQSGFGRTGTVDWATTPKTSTFTGVSGKGYFINSGSALTCNLPAGTAGDIISFSDYARNFATYNFTISPDGSEKIGGQANDATLNVNGQAATFVYVDSTKGWVNVQNAEDTEVGELPYICASVSGSGNTQITDGDYKIAVFTGPGTFCVSGVSGTTPARNNVDWMVVAGGGAGGESWRAGAGGAGGFRESPGAATGCYTTSPLAGGCAVTVTAQGYPITVGAGGTGGQTPACQSTNGDNSSALGITSTGGGSGGSYNPTSTPQNIGDSGGSGGGGGGCASGPRAGGNGNTPPTSPAQGFDGGDGGPGPGGSSAGGGGGGATAGGTTGSSPAPGPGGGLGGNGAGTSITPSPSYGTPGPSGSLRYYAGGGGGGHYCSPQPPTNGSAGGYGGGGPGGIFISGCNYTGGTAGTVNTGGGGGGKAGTAAVNTGGNGGSGVVMIRYKFQN